MKTRFFSPCVCRPLATGAVIFVLTGVATYGPSALDAQTAVPSDPETQEVNAIRREQVARTPVQKKIDSQLLYASHVASTGVAVEGVPALRSTVRPEADGRYKVRIAATVSDELLTAIKSMGGEVLSSHPTYRAVYALVPVGSLEALAARADVQSIGMPPKARVHAGGVRVLPAGSSPSALQRSREVSPQTTPAEVDTAVNDPEGDAAHGAKMVRTLYGANGTGVKIGILSDSIDDSSGSYPTAMNAGYVTPVTVVPGQAGTGEAEGLAMLEIAHRLSPGSALYFAQGGPTPEQMASNINALQADGCQIISDDITFDTESPFQDEAVSLAVVNVTGKGSLFFPPGATAAISARARRAPGKEIL